jgi:hypothetical protein
MILPRPNRSPMKISYANLVRPPTLGFPDLVSRARDPHGQSRPLILYGLGSGTQVLFKTVPCQSPQFSPEPLEAHSAGQRSVQGRHIAAAAPPVVRASVHDLHLVCAGNSPPHRSRDVDAKRRHSVVWLRARDCALLRCSFAARLSCARRIKQQWLLRRRERTATASSTVTINVEAVDLWLTRGRNFPSLRPVEDWGLQESRDRGSTGNSLFSVPGRVTFSTSISSPKRRSSSSFAPTTRARSSANSPGGRARRLQRPKALIYPIRLATASSRPDSDP